MIEHYGRFGFQTRSGASHSETHPGSCVTVSTVKQLAQQFVRSSTEPRTRIVDTQDLSQPEAPDLEINYLDKRPEPVNRRVTIVDNLTGEISE